MLKNYLKTAFRNLIRNKTFSVITILGLAGGLTCSMLILTFVVDELSYDKFHTKKDRIYRLRYFIGDFDIARVPPVFKENLNFFPEIESSARLFSRSVSVRVPSDDNDDRRFEEPNVNFTDPELFKIFDFELLSGQLEGALEEPFTVVLNEEVSMKYFNSTDVIGESIVMEGDQSFKVIAVVKEFPTNSHVHFDMLLPYDNMYDLEPEGLREAIRNNFKVNWMVSHSPTYVLLNQSSSPEAVNNRFVEFVNEKIPENQQKGQRFEVQPLLDIHLNDEVQAQAEPPGSRQFIFIFIAVGILTLLIACINFVNLSTAKSLERAKEIGMRKVLGAWRTHLISQFMGESFVTTILASAISIWFTLMLLPQLNALTNKELTIDILSTPIIVAGFIVITLVTAFLAGLYPSFFVTRVAPIRSLKGLIASSNGNLSFRRALIVIQFAISIMLISSAFIVFDQLKLLRTKPLGFNKDFIITVPIQSANFNSVFGGVDEEKRQTMNAFEDALASIPGVLGSTVSSTPPGFGMVNRNIIPEGFTAEDNMLAPVMSIDYDFLDTYEIDLLSGRDFDRSFGTDEASAFLINETAVRAFNFTNNEDALGKEINLEGKVGKVVGVVGDFHFLALSETMRPLIMEILVPQFSTFSIKLNNQNIPATLTSIEQTWNDFFPDQTFDHSFLDEALAQNYETQEQFGTLVGYFAFLAIFISCLGSYGLIMFIASQKKKEVGIRKVLGASVIQVVTLLSSRFLIMVIIAMIIAVPITYYLAVQWLENFSYRISPSPLSFVVASVLTIILVLLTVSAQSLKAAISNPTHSLRSE
jgi:putative ABC transport system permease protein